MKPFLKETAEDVLKKHKGNLNKICIVFPNKRTRLFFRKHFADSVGETDWAVNMMDIRRLVRDFIKLKEPDKLSLNFDLFEIFKKVNKTSSNKYSFDKFYRLGEIILNDFNEIDSWLVDPPLIFRNIKDVEEIENVFDWLSDEQKSVLRTFWQNFSPEKQSEEKKKFIELWNLLPEIYKQFTESLLEKNLAYNGLLFRQISNKISKGELKTGKYEKYIFTGFNALNKAEETLFNYLKEKGKAEFYWDTDKYYQFDKKQESGDFLRKNFKALNIFEENLPDNLISKHKNIDVIGVPLETGQAKLIPTILENYDIDEKGDDTAIVLSDEHLLFPVLHSLPEFVENINITMGYPFSATSLFNLIQQYLKLQSFAFKSKNRIKTYYYKDVIALIKHPYIWESAPEISKFTLSEIENNNSVYIPAKELIEKDSELYRIVFAPLDDKNPTENLLENLLTILFILFDKSKDSEGKTVKTIENEYIHRVYTSIKRFKEIINSKNIDLGILLTIDLLKQILMAEQVPFSGEAVEGLQLMGVLETRNLDFKNLIILGMNEGNFPSISQPQSFISQSIRYVFGMPLVKYQDSVYAYLFYRLIQRAENITFVYNNIINSSTTGEISRFIQQLDFESGLKINHKQFKQDLIPASQKQIIIKKNDDILLKLSKYFSTNGYCERRLSASAINSFIDCPLQFYFRYIAGLRTLDTVEEDISHAAFGTILHDSLENIYTYITKEKKSKTIEQSDFKELDKKVPDYVV